ncbi:MAG: SpoIIE family protein phosphatase [Candidatus Acidiferrales bacterium]
MYSRDVDWDALKKKKNIKRCFLAAWALFQAMLMKLSPARRVLLMVAMVGVMNEAGQEYAEARLVALLRSAPPETAAETLKRVMADVSQFVGFVRQHDDITCLVLRVNA